MADSDEYDEVRQALEDDKPKPIRRGGKGTTAKKQIKTEAIGEKPKINRAELLAKARAAKAEKAKARKQETVFDMGSVAKELKPEIVEEVIRVPAKPKQKKIVKRTLEIEESDDTEEEVVEEIVKVPKMKKEVKINRDEMKKKLIEANSKRLLNELFS